MPDHVSIHTVESLYSDHHGWLQGWLRRKLGDTHQAADLSHDTFLRILTSRDVTSIREPRTFLATVAGGLVANHYRRRAIEQAYLDAISCLPEPQVPSPEHRAIVMETLLEIDRMLDGLPPKARRAFLLSQLEGLTYVEIAEQIGVSVSMVKQYMRRATQQCYFSLTV
nr:sigma-70 family RNA polymerase sigma factor [Ottowia thiooxydans]